MFRRSTNFRGGYRARRDVAAWIALAGLLCGSGAAHADYFTDNSQTYVDATGGALGNTINSTTSSHTDWITATDVAHDGKWFLASAVTPLIENNNVLTADGPESETVPQITTTISDLAPGVRYEVYVVYVGRYSPGHGEDWALQAAISGNTLNVWDGTGTTGTATGPSAPGAFDDDVLKQYEGDLGVAIADGSGSLSVDVNQLASGFGDDRAWYDGVAFTELPEPASLSMLGVSGLLLIRRRRCGR